MTRASSDASVKRPDRELREVAVAGAAGVLDAHDAYVYLP